MQFRSRDRSGKNRSWKKFQTKIFKNEKRSIENRSKMGSKMKEYPSRKELIKAEKEEHKNYKKYMQKQAQALEGKRAILQFQPNISSSFLFLFFPNRNL